jgi:hypothetical protein
MAKSEELRAAAQEIYEAARHVAQGAKSERKARERRQARVAKAVWGILLITMGVLFTLNELGRIDMSPPSWRHPASMAFDGDPKTRWSSGFSDPQWIAVDLGAPARIEWVKLNWESAYAKAYQIQVSDDASNWTTLVSETDGDGEVDEHDVSATARYVRMYGTARATPYGYSLWEFEIYGTRRGAGTPAAGAPAPASLLSRGDAPMASSKEANNPWPIYWPLLLVAGGLPALLAPKDGGDQVVGFLMAAAGVLLQLRRLELTTWGFRETMPLVLILAGAMLLLQSWRRGDGSEPRPGGEAGGVESLS